MPSSNAASEGLKNKVLCRMNADRYHHIILQDNLILQYGSQLFQKCGAKRHKEIANKLRELARFVDASQKMSTDITELSQVIHPSKFDFVVSVVRNLCGYDNELRQYKVPSLALKIGTHLKNVSKVLAGQASRKSDHAAEKDALSFFNLCSNEWTTEVSGIARENLDAAKWNKPNEIPLAADVKLVADYLTKQIVLCTERVKQNKDVRDWVKLCRAALAYLVLFNRRRVGEMQKLEVATYMNRNKNQISADFAESLSPFEQNLCDYFDRLEIRGKRGRKVAVLMPSFLVAAMDELIIGREEAGVSADSPYLFAKTQQGSVEPEDAAKCLREAVNETHCQHPNWITSTRLRKQIATQLQILSLKENEQDVIANFLGHDIRIHRQYYRLPEGTLQLAKVSKILLALESGALQKFGGKSLDDIDAAEIGITFCY
jgi:hypothetical protein